MWILWALATAQAFPGEEHAFVSYGRIPTWTGVASDLADGPRTPVRVDVYDPDRYPGHADFASTGLKTGWTFKQFKAAVRDADRSHLPFFLYDLRGQAPRVAGRARTWAVRIEDYGYTDSGETLGEDVVRVADAVARLTGFAREDGLIVLARGEIRPGEDCAATVSAAGWAHATLSGLRSGEPAPTEVLNPGVAVGVLKRFDADAPFAVGPRDIVVYDALPERVPPVAGILTLAAQTPLSHVNLLARNRGTPNVHLESLAALDAQGATFGTPVRLVASEDGLTVTPIDRATMEAFYDRQPARRLAIPTPTDAGWVDFPEPGSDRPLPPVEDVGAKAANYAALRELLPEHVRPGGALGFGAYRAHVRAARPAIDALLADLEALDAAQIADRLEAIRTTIRKTPVDAGLLDQLEATLQSRWPNTRVRLRSSTNCEDLPRFNGAGLYQSKGFDVGEDSRKKLEKKLKQVFASLWSEHAFAERTFYGIDHHDVAMAVLVHEAFPDEAANGVVLTVPRRDGSGVDVVVNANPGEAAVTNPEPDEQPERLSFPMGGPTSQAEVAGHSSIGPVFTGFAASRLPDLAAHMATIHARFAAPQSEADGQAYGVDVEWKLVHTPTTESQPGGLKLVYKQVRLLSAPSPE